MSNDQHYKALLQDLLTVDQAEKLAALEEELKTKPDRTTCIMISDPTECARRRRKQQERDWAKVNRKKKPGSASAAGELGDDDE